MQKSGRQTKPAAPPPEDKKKGVGDQIKSTELAMDPEGPPANEEYGQHKDRRKAKTETGPRRTENEA